MGSRPNEVHIMRTYRNIIEFLNSKNFLVKSKLVMENGFIKIWIKADEKS